MSGLMRRRSRRGKRPGRWLGVVLLWLLVLTLLATAAGFLGWMNWVFDGFSHFRVQYALAAPPLAAALLLLRRPRAAVLALAVFLVNGWQVAPQVLGGGGAIAAQTAGSEPLRLAAVNLLAANRAHDRVRAFIARERPDMVVLVELTPAWAAALAGLNRDYPHRLLIPGDGGYGIGLLSRRPWREARAIDPGGSGLPSVEARFDGPDGGFTLIGTHPRQPGGDAAWRQRNRQLRGLARHIGGLSGAVAAMGDFNSTPWSVHLMDFARMSGLANAAGGRGWRPTWPTWFPPAGVAIDHVFVSPQVSVLDWRTGPYIGSDHLPVVADIVF